ncbi:Leucine-rich repeats and immunoglobulin-like domains protein 2 [Manis javanica]|nr:Leucine-rich repeats and immunoglobulin-like domains protein 2 [Manis javanica]
MAAEGQVRYSAPSELPPVPSTREKRNTASPEDPNDTVDSRSSPGKQELHDPGKILKGKKVYYFTLRINRDGNLEMKARIPGKKPGRGVPVLDCSRKKFEDFSWREKISKTGDKD